MTLEQFVAKYNGKYIDFDGFYGPQCVDLIKKWITEGLGYPANSVPNGNAKDIFNNFVNNQYFKKVFNNYNDPNQFPPPGAIVFWGAPYGFYFDHGIPRFAGHTSINSKAWGTALVTFDQNWGQPNFCRYVNHNYKYMLGWLIPLK